MNRIDGPVCLYRLDVPRERGDEPNLPFNAQNRI